MGFGGRRNELDDGSVARPQTAKVLVHGGGNTQDAEAYDSATGQWTMAGGTFFAPPSWPDLAVLPNGHVLLAGGWVYGAQGTTEAYDPDTGWYSTGRRTVERSYPTVVSLADGRVLLIGGWVTIAGFNENLSSVEIYDPDTLTWGTTGDLVRGRSSHSATLLSDGNVLVVGGTSSTVHGQPALTSELFDTEASTWTEIDGPFFNRSQHTATLLHDGNVVVVGGMVPTDVGETDAVEVYDAATGTWSAVGTVRVPRRYGHTATTLKDGRVLVTGGYSAEHGYLDAVEIYDPSTRVWSDAASLSTRRLAHTATLLPDGKVLVAGGQSADGPVTEDSAELYDPTSEAWTSTGSLNVKRAGHAAAAFDVRDIPLPVG